MTKVTEDAGVKASQEEVDKPTTTEESPSKETKETKGNEAEQQIVDAEIAKDLLKDEDSEESEEDSTEEITEETEKEDKTESEEEKSDEQEAEAAKKGAQARKEALQTEIRDLVAKRNELRAANDEVIDRNYRVETSEELVEQGLTEAEAENEVLKQQMQMQDFKQHVNELNATLNIQSLQVLQDFPAYDESSPDFNETLRDRVRDLYQQAAKPKVDPKTKLVVENSLMPYDFYKAFADTDAEARADVQTKVEQSRTEGKVEGQKAADKELAEAETPTAAPPSKKSAKQDPFLSGLLNED